MGIAPLFPDSWPHAYDNDSTELHKGEDSKWSERWSMCFFGLFCVLEAVWDVPSRCSVFFLSINNGVPSKCLVFFSYSIIIRITSRLHFLPVIFHIVFLPLGLVASSHPHDSHNTELELYMGEGSNWWERCFMYFFADFRFLVGAWDSQSRLICAHLCSHSHTQLYVYTWIQ